MADHRVEAGGPIILIGYSGAVLATLSTYLPERSLIFVDEPDVLRKRNAYALTADSPTLRELIEWEYLRADEDPAYGADCFYHRYRDLQPRAVVPIIEYGVPFAARLAERYGVRGAGYGAALALRDKARQRAITAAAGIANPRSVAVTGPDQLQQFLTEVGGPVVLKPANRQGSLGTQVVHPGDDVAAVWHACLRQDEGVFVPDRPMPLQMLAEEYIHGDEYSVEMMVEAGRSAFGAVTRKYLYPGVRPVEQGHLHPADIDDALTARLLADTERVVQAVGMNYGFVHCEWMVREGVPYFIECAGRMAGDGIIELVLMAWDYDVVGEFYAMMQGSALTITPPERATRYAAAWTSVADTPGVVAAVDGITDAEQVPGVRTAATLPVGSRVHGLTGSADRVTLVTAAGDTPQAALSNAQHAVSLLKVTVRPEE